MMSKWRSFDINQRIEYDGPGVYRIRLFREDALYLYVGLMKRNSNGGDVRRY